jgi:hypothetical protein
LRVVLRATRLKRFSMSRIAKIVFVAAVRGVVHSETRSA